MDDDDEVHTLVLDNGASMIRAGEAGDDLPRFPVEPEVGRTAPCRYPAPVVEAVEDPHHEAHPDMLALRDIVRDQGEKAWAAKNWLQYAGYPPPLSSSHRLPDGEVVPGAEIEILPTMPPPYPPFSAMNYSPWGGLHLTFTKAIVAATLRRFPSVDGLLQRQLGQKAPPEQSRSTGREGRGRGNTGPDTATAVCGHRSDTVDQTSTGTCAPVVSGGSSRKTRDELIAAAVDAMTAPPERHAPTPIVHKGMITDWDRAEAMWLFATADVFDPRNSGARFDDQRRVLVAVPPHVGPTQVRRTCEVLLETLHYESITLQSPCLLGLMATGRQTGMHIHCGAGYSAAMPALEGYPLPRATAVSPVCGNDATEALRRALEQQRAERGERSEGGVPWEDVEDLKVRCSSVARSVGAAAALNAADFAAQFSASGASIPRGFAAGYTPGPELVQCNEALFNPSAVSGLEGAGITEMVLRSFRSLDPDLHSQMMDHCVFLGGAARATGAYDRLQEELQPHLRELCPHWQRPFRIKGLPDASELKNAVWMGGSIMGSLMAYHGAFVTTETIAEKGLFAAFPHPMYTHKY